MTATHPALETRPRKRPSQARSRATIDAVLAAAAHILEAGGVAAFNTNAVAERAGVSIGSLYQYFPNKDAILVALIEGQTADFADSIAELAQSAAGASFAEDLRLLLEKALEWHARQPNLSRILDAEERRLRPGIDLCVAEGSLQATLICLLQRRQAGLAGASLERLAQDVSALVRALMEAEAEREAHDWPAAIDRTVGAVMGYLAANGRLSAAAAAA